MEYTIPENVASIDPIASNSIYPAIRDADEHDHEPGPPNLSRFTFQPFALTVSHDEKSVSALSSAEHTADRKHIWLMVSNVIEDVF